jgi:hypothetical protein
MNMMRSCDYGRYPIRHCIARKLQRRLPIGRTVIDARQYVIMNIDHQGTLRSAIAVIRHYSTEKSTAKPAA